VILEEGIPVQPLQAFHVVGITPTGREEIYMTAGSRDRKPDGAVYPAAFNSSRQFVCNINDPAFRADLFIASWYHVLKISFNTGCLKVPVNNEHLFAPLG